MKSKVKEKYTKQESRIARIAVRKYLLTGEQRQNGWLLHSRDYGVYTYVIARQPESGTVSWAHRVDSTGRLYRISKDKLIRFEAAELAVQELQAVRMSASDIGESGSGFALKFKLML
jgi:hypothetical protein